MFLVHFITYLFHLMSSIWVFKKILGLSNPTKDTPWVDICFSIILAVLLAGGEFAAPTLRILALTTMIFAQGSLYYKQSFHTGLAAAIIAVGISLLFYSMGAILSYPVAFATAESTGVPIDDVEVLQLSQILTGIVEIVLAILIFKIPRLKRGMPFLQNNNLNDITSIIGLALLGGTILVGDIDKLQYGISIVLACGTTVFVWWNNRLKDAYREKQKERQTEMLEQKVTELESEANERERIIDELSKFAHRQRKLMPAAYLELKAFLESGVLKDQECEQAIRARLEDFHKEFESSFLILSDYESVQRPFSDSGIASVDAIVRWAAIQAAAQDTYFEFGLGYCIPSLVSETGIAVPDLTTILSDLMENSLIAVREKAVKCIRVYIMPPSCDSRSHICIQDSGAQFQPETIRKLGLERTTTHSEDGGSGIGLMTIFEILRKYKASFEMCDEPEYERTKSIIIRFDGKNEIVIRTTRDEIMEISKEREDITFYKLKYSSKPDI